jgi:subtilisin family serine protease
MEQRHKQRGDKMDALALVKLSRLMEQTTGSPELIIGLLDGPVATTHPDLAHEHICEVPGGPSATCTRPNSAACGHGTFVAGILSGHRGSPAPAICPDCTLLVRPIFSETTPNSDQLPSATAEELAGAILACIEAGAHVINLSAGFTQPSTRTERALKESLDYAAQRGVIVVAAAGNQGTLGSSVITRHSWVIPVVAYDLAGRPVGQSNLGHSIGRHGLGAPGDNITSLGAEGKAVTLGGTSVAAPFVTGTIALLWSLFPVAAAAAVKLAVTHNRPTRRTTVVPPLLDAWAAYQALETTYAKGVVV